METDDLSLIVFVSKKLELHELPRDHRIPRLVDPYKSGAPFPTDVVEWPETDEECLESSDDDTLASWLLFEFFLKTLSSLSASPSSRSAILSTAVFLPSLARAAACILIAANSFFLLFLLLKRKETLLGCFRALFSGTKKFHSVKKKREELLEFF